MESKKKYHSKSDALTKLQRYCAYQERCHTEVRSKLLELGIYGDDLEEIIASLITDNYLSEERFARSFARGKFLIKRWGRQRIRMELKRRQVTDYCIKKAMEEIGEEEYRAALLSLIEKKTASLPSESDYVVRNTVAQYAMQRGFESDLVWEMLNG